MYVVAVARGGVCGGCRMVAAADGRRSGRQQRPGPAARLRPSSGWPHRPRSTCCAVAATRSTPPSRPPAVLGVTEPFSCGIGGGGFMVIQERRAEADHDRPPRGGAGGDEAGLVLGERCAARIQLARYSGLSVGVPGTVRGWERALKKHGTISLAEALRRRSRSRSTASSSTRRSPTRPGERGLLQRHPVDCRALPRSRTAPPATSARCSKPRPRAYLQLLAHLGAKAFYRAESPRRSRHGHAPAGRADANHVWRPGVMTARDLRGYTRSSAPPTQVSYRGLDVYGMGPPSSGGSTVGEALNILEGYPSRA